MKPKIAIVRGAFLNRYEMQFYEPLVREFDITAFASRHPFHDQYAFPVVKLPSPMDLPEFPLKMPLLNRIFVDAHYLLGLTERLRGFDLVHSAELYYHYTQQCLDAKKSGYVKKALATVLENIPFNNEAIWGRRRFKQRARTELDAMIALTKKTRQAMVKEGADPDKITIISHFIDTKRFKPDKKQQNQIHDKSNIQFIIGFAGRLEEYKGVMDALKAFRMLKADPALKKYRLMLKFAGKGSLYSEMRRYEIENDLNNYITHVDVSYQSMPNFYQSCQIYLAPSKPSISWDEQYNTSLLEAQACGLPIVTTNTGGIPENVGNAALLVPAGDTESIYKALKSLLTSADLRTSLSVKARNRAVKVHDITIGAGKLSALYHRLLRK